MSAKNIGIGFVVLLVAGIISRIFVGDISMHVSVAPEKLFSIGGVFPFMNSVLVTILVDIFLIVLASMATKNMKMVPRGLQNFMEWVIESLYNLFAGINRDYAPKAFPVLATIFLFVLVSNWSGLLPGFGSIGMCQKSDYHGTTESRLALHDTTSLDATLLAAPAGDGPSPYIGCDPGETLIPYFRAPSADLNMTLALTVFVMIMIEYFGFQALGVGYLGKFFNFHEGVMGFLVGLLELISEIARIPAFMFRLFGNIFAGEVLLVVMIFMIPLGWPLPFYGFEVFVGFIQAFVFSVLTMAFIAVAVTPHGGDHGDAHGDAH